MAQLAARAAPSVICGRRCPFQFGNMTKPLQFVPNAPNPTRFGLPHKQKALPSSQTTEPKQTEKETSHRSGTGHIASNPPDADNLFA